jgi:hypothetical protein
MNKQTSKQTHILEVDLSLRVFLKTVFYHISADIHEPARSYIQRTAKPITFEIFKLQGKEKDCDCI